MSGAAGTRTVAGLVGALTCAAVGAARADAYERGGALAVRADAAYAAAEAGDAATLGLGVRILRDRRWLGGFELRAGGAADGFAYDVRVMPLGFGVRLGSRTELGVMLGAGLSGVTGTVDLGVPLTAEVIAEREVRHAWRLGLAVRTTWIALAPARDVDLAAVGTDELLAGVALRTGLRRDAYNGRAARGPRLAVAWRRDALGDAVVFQLGYAVDIGWAETPAPFPARGR